MPALNGTGGSLHTRPVTLSTTPQAIVSDRPGGQRVGLLLQNPSASDVYFSENPAVAASGPTQGFLLKGGQTVPVTFGDVTISGSLYAVAASGTPTIVVGDVY
jgi:hypothetical protein